MPECFYLTAVSLCGGWPRSWRSAWGRGSASSDRTRTHRPARPPVSGKTTHTHTHTHTPPSASPSFQCTKFFRYETWQIAHHVVCLCCSRREIHSAPLLGGLSSDSEREPEEEEEEEDGAENDDANDPEDIATNTSSDSSHGEEDTGNVVHRGVWVSAICSDLTFISPRRAAQKQRRDQTQCCFIIFLQLLIIALFHATGGSDEGQDWEEPTKVGGV